MASILSALSTIFDTVIGFVQTVGAVIAGGTVGSGADAVTYAANPLLLLFVLIPIIGIGVGLFKRLLNVN